MPNAIHLCVSTISATCADWLAEQHRSQGSRYVSGPVVGRPDAAAQGTLLEFPAGDSSGVKEVQPACRAFATTLLPIAGSASLANSQKLRKFFHRLADRRHGRVFDLRRETGASPESMTQFFPKGLARTPG